MARIVVDDATAALLRWVKEPVELVDQAGCRLGAFTRVDEKTQYRDLEIPFLEEELRRSESEPGGCTLDEVLADLEHRA